MIQNKTSFLATTTTIARRVFELGNPRTIIQNLWSHRYLIEQMIRRDVSQRYRGSFLGLIWSVLNPLFMLLIYTFVFSVVFKARWRPTAEELPMGEFALTLFAGLIPFYLFSETVTRSPMIVTAFPNYVKKVVFPLEILPVVIAGTAIINSMINLGILFVASLLMLGRIPATFIFIPLIYVTLLLLCLGLSWFLASWGVYIRDVGQIVTIATQVLFFISPIFYPTSSVPKSFRIVVDLNPLSMIVDNFRKLLLWGEFFPLRSWAFWTLAAALIAIGGYVWFMATKKGFADVI